MNAVSSTHLPRRWLWLARIVWLLIFFLAIWKLALGTPLIYAEKLVVCTNSAEICAQGISPSLEEIKALEDFGISQSGYAFWVIAFRILETLVWMGVGILLFILRPDDWLALLVSAVMVLFTTGYSNDPIIRVYPHLGWLAQFGFSLQNALLFMFVGLFPSGRFAPRWMRWYWFLMVFLALGGENVIAKVSSVEQQSADRIWGPLWLSFLILGPYSQIYRYRKVSTPIERLQTRWVVFGFAAMAGFIILGVLLEQARLLPGVVLGDFLFGLGALALPISIGVSVLRFHLWDIDLVIRRTLVYGALTVTLALMYFGSVILLQGLFEAISGQGSAVAVVLSTLVIAAMFSPLRRRIQNDIDRRFYRRKYDAEKVVAAFSTSLRDEVDLEELQNQILAVVQETLQPESLTLWLKEKN